MKRNGKRCGIKNIKTLVKFRLKIKTDGPVIIVMELKKSFMNGVRLRGNSIRVVL